MSGELATASAIFCKFWSLFSTSKWMFIKVPETPKNKATLSFVFSKLPVLNSISSGMRVIILTVLISLAAAVLFPREEEDDDAV